MDLETGASSRRGRERRTCLELCDALRIVQSNPLRSKVLGYLTVIEGIQLSSDVDDASSADRLCSASAIFLALYDRSPQEGGKSSADYSSGSESVSGAPNSCRLGELLRHVCHTVAEAFEERFIPRLRGVVQSCRACDECGVGVRDFMEHLTLVAGRMPESLSEQLHSDLRVLKEGIVVTKMLHGKYRQLWNERNSLLAHVSSRSCATVDGASSNDTAPMAEGDHDKGYQASLAPSTDPEALPRLGWYLYLVTKEVLGFGSSNVAFMRCLNLVLGTLGALVWNSSPRSLSAASDEDRSHGKERVVIHEGERTAGVSTRAVSRRAATSLTVEMSEGECAEGGDGSGGGCESEYDSEASLLAAISASGRCPANEVRAMSAKVVEVIEALLEEGIIVSNCSAYSSPTSSSGKTGGAFPSDSPPHGESSSSAVTSKAVGGGESPNGGGNAAARAIDSPAPGSDNGTGTHTDVKITADFSGPLFCRAKRVAGVFHPFVAAQNAAKLDACYWARVSRRGAGGLGGVGVLDETFVLTPSLRDTAGTPCCDRSMARAATLTPSVSLASRQLFQDYQKASASAAGSTCPDNLTDVSSVGLRLGPSHSLSGNGPTTTAVATASSNLVDAAEGFQKGNGEGGAKSARGAYGILQSPLTLPASRVGGSEGGAEKEIGRLGMEAVVGRSANVPPDTPVMAAMEAVKWIANLDSVARGAPASLLEKLEKCATASPTMIQERLTSLMARLDGPATARQPQRPHEQDSINSEGDMPFMGPRSRHGGGESAETNVLGEAKAKGEALYYITLEALLDAETARLHVEDHSQLLRQGNLHGAILACCLEVVLKASSLLSLTFPWVLRRMEIDALDLCKMLESFARFCPGLPRNLKYHLYEVQTEIVERLALEDGAGVFRLIREHKAVGQWPVAALKETDVAPPTGSRLDVLPSPQKRQVQQQQASPPSPSLTSRPESREREGAISAAATMAVTASAGPREAGGRQCVKATVAEGVSGASLEARAPALPSAEAAAAAAASRARTSTLDMYFGKLLQRAAEVVAELCLRRLRLPGDTADQVWTVIKRCVAQRTEMLKDRHLHHVVLCSTYSVCKVNSVTPEVTFKRIIEQYKQLTGPGGAGGPAGGVGTPRLTVIKDILLKEISTGEGAGGGDKTGGGEYFCRREERGDIIKFYNQVYIPAMKHFVLEFKNLAGQKQGVASIANAQDAVRVAQHVSKRSNAAVAQPSGTPEGPWPGAAGTTCGAETHSPPCHRRLTPSDGVPLPAVAGREDFEGSDVDGSGGYGRDGNCGDPRGGEDSGSEDDFVAADVVAAGAALSALSSAPHPQMPLVSHLPSQRMTSPKRVQDNVFLTTVTTPARSGRRAGFTRPASPAASSARAGGNESSGRSGSSRPTCKREVETGTRAAREAAVVGGGRGGGGSGGGSCVYAFGESLSKDLQVINRTVRAVGEDSLSYPPPSSKRMRGSLTANRPPH